MNRDKRRRTLPIKKRKGVGVTLYLSLFLSLSLSRIYLLARLCVSGGVVNTL